MSKWTGESERLVRVMFSVAKSCAPSVLFVDELDALAASRNDSGDMTSHRVLTEFLIAFSNLNGADGVIVIAATNCLHKLDSAMLRRFDRLLAVELPDAASRVQLLNYFLRDVQCSLSDHDLECISDEMTGLSASDIKCACRDSSAQPFKAISTLLFENHLHRRMRGPHFPSRSSEDNNDHELNCLTLSVPRPIIAKDILEAVERCKKRSLE